MPRTEACEPHGEPSVSFVPQILTEHRLCAWPCGMWWKTHKLLLCPDTVLGSAPQGFVFGPITPHTEDRGANQKKTEVDPTQKHLGVTRQGASPPVATYDSGWWPENLWVFRCLPEPYIILCRALSYLIESQKEKNNLSKCFPSIYSF